jgi:hypothetical protein
MKTNIKLVGFFVAVFIMAVAAGQVVQGVLAAPGSSDDPLVTKSYVDVGTKFTILELSAGQVLLSGDSAEVVLRSGQATVIAGTNGGMSDVTTDGNGNLVTGDAVVLNHLMISARNDGRGIRITSASAFIMVRGPYSIQ